MSEGLVPLTELGYEVAVTEFNVGDFDALQNISHKAETDGPSAVTLDNELVADILASDLLVVHFCPVSKELIERHDHLELIGTCRTGLSYIDTDAAKANRVPVINCVGRLANAVADFTVGMIICEARNIARGHHGLKNGEWIRRYPNLGNIPDLPGRTVGLVGLGAIGQATAKRLKAFDMEIIAYDPYIDPALPASLGIAMVALEELMSRSDFVSIHVDLNPSTKNLISAELIGRMKRNSYFINTSRASVVDEKALISALKNNRIAGAALDVYQDEPPGIDHPLVALENVTLTPHMAGGSDDAFRKSPALLCKRITDHLSRTAT